MGPGPSPVSSRVLQALGRPTIGHLDPKFVEFMESLKTMLRLVFRTENQLTFPVSAPGSSGMEMCFVNLLEPGEKIIICRNGVFGDRMRENAERCGAQVVMLDFAWGRAVDNAVVSRALDEHKDAKVLAFVHAETSTGALSDAEGLARIAQAHGCLTIMDAVTSLGGVAVEIDRWGIDACYSGSQKCLSCVPGLSPVTFNERAIAKIKERKTKVQSWFLDLNLVMAYWGSSAKRTYHHTAPVNTLYGLHEALVLLLEEGLENSWKRHASVHKTLVSNLKLIGLEMLVPELERLPQLNSVQVPEGIDESKVRTDLLNKFKLEIGAGLGPLTGKIWRIGLMGGSATEWHANYCVSALKAAF